MSIIISASEEIDDSIEKKDKCPIPVGEIKRMFTFNEE